MLSEKFNGKLVQNALNLIAFFFEKFIYIILGLLMKKIISSVINYYLSS